MDGVIHVLRTKLDNAFQQGVGGNKGRKQATFTNLPFIFICSSLAIWLGKGLPVGSWGSGGMFLPDEEGEEVLPWGECESWPGKKRERCRSGAKGMPSGPIFTMTSYYCMGR